MGDIGNLYVSPYRVQAGRNYSVYYSSGRGVGSIFKGILNFLTPMLKQGTKAIGSELLKGGAEVIENLGGEKSFKTLVEEQRDKRLENLQKKAINKIQKMQSGGSIRSIKASKKLPKGFIKGLVVAPLRSRVGKAVKKQVKRKRKSPSKRRKNKRQTSRDIFDY